MATKKAKKAKASNWASLTVGASSKQNMEDRIRNLDGFHTPSIAVDKLVENYKLMPRIWEPANGFNRISNRLEVHGKTVHRSDIFAWSKKTKDVQDFTGDKLKVPFKGGYDIGRDEVIKKRPVIKSG